MYSSNPLKEILAFRVRVSKFLPAFFVRFSVLPMGRGGG